LTSRFYFSSPVRLLPKLTNTDKIYRQYCDQGSSLPLTEVTPLDMTPRTSLIDYERTTTATTNDRYDNVHEKNKQISLDPLPPTPTTSRIVTFKNSILKHERSELPVRIININKT
jgi:hypothetical protein